MEFLKESLTKLHVKVATAEEAIRESGRLLLEAGHVEEKYITAMIDSYREQGPYFVLAPNIAMPHARPEDGVIQASVSMVQLEEPVHFGSEANDPVYLVFALAGSSNEGHLQLLQKLSGLLGDPHKVKGLIHARDYQEIKNLIGGE